jgi:hypothetical protein
MKPNTNLVNVTISKDTHKILVDFIQQIDGKVGKFADKAIREKIDRETKKDKK